MKDTVEIFQSRGANHKNLIKHVIHLSHTLYEF